MFERIYPMHVFSEDPAAAAAELNEALPEYTLATEPSCPAGPLVVRLVGAGVQMNLVRNDLYNGSVSPDVTRAG